MKTALRPLVMTLAVAFFAGTMSSASAQIYKWTNDDGTTTYSSEAPEDRASKPDLTIIVPPPARVEVQPSAPPAANAASKSPEPQVSVAEPAARPEADAPRRPSVRSLLPQAVQDPCLRSSDPLCHQKHSAYYKPYVGYTPEPRVAEAPNVVAPARGATSSAAAGGSVSGGTRTK